MAKEKVVAVVLPGPSAPETRKDDASYDEVVVVNAAVRLVKRPCWFLVTQS